MKRIAERQSDLKQTISTRLPTKTRRKVGVSALPAGRRLDPKGHHRRRRTYAISTVLAALVSLSAFPAGLAEAQQTMGGNGGNPGGQTSGGGAGGVSGVLNPEASPGTATNASAANGAGGGGGGAAGEAGGNGGNGGLGNGANTPQAATSGASGNPGGSGGSASSNFGGGGGGGGGGSHGQVIIATTTLTTDTDGGIGGMGGTGGSRANIDSHGGGGGGGGAGGYGVVIVGSNLTLTNGSDISGGIGGAGGAGGDGGPGGQGGGGGNGGDGGVGVFLTNSNTLINAGTIAGGNGGAGGAAGAGANSSPGMIGMAGAGGVGVVGTGNDTVINSGTISGGFRGGIDNEANRADAVELSSGGNTLELWAGFNIIGNAVSTSGSGPGGDTLALGGTKDSSFDVSQIGLQYQGFAKFLKTGTSTWELTTTGAIVYDIPVTIQEGTLAVGPTTGPGSVEGVSNALGFGNVNLEGGTLRTTSNVSTGKELTIKVGGNYVQGRNGTLSLGLGGRPIVEDDHIELSGGSITLGGTLEIHSDRGFHPVSTDSFTLITGGPRLHDSRFAAINDTFNNNPNLHRWDLYAENGFGILYLPEPAETIEVPKDLPPGPGPIPNSFLLAALNPTGEELTAMFQIPFANGFTQRLNLNDRMLQIRQGSTGFVSPMAPAPPPAAFGKEEVSKKEVAPPALVPSPTNRWGVWMNGWGNFASLNDHNGVKGYDFTTGGGTLGIDYRITDCLAIGVFGSGAHSWTDLKPGSVDVNTGLGGIYATYWSQGFWVNGAVYAGANNYDTSRPTLLRGQFANGSTDGYEISTWITTGYDFKFNNLSIGPTFSAQYVNAHIDSFREHGAFLPLDVHSDSEESWVTDLGFQAQYTWHVGNITVIPSLYAAWEHQYKVSRLPITFGAADFPGVTATTFSPDMGQDSCIIDAGANVQWTPRISTYIGYHGQVGARNYEANGVSGTFSFSF